MGLLRRALVTGLVTVGPVVARKAVTTVRGRGRGVPVLGTVAKADTRRCHAVTILRDADELAPGGRLPETLAAVEDLATITLRPAPGARGTEVLACVLTGADGKADPGTVRAVRRALREARQVAETGFVLSADRPGAAEPTALNAPVRAATAHGRDGGRL